MRRLLLVAMTLALVPSAAQANLTHWGAWDAGANICLIHSFQLPGNAIDARLRLYRTSPSRFVGHCTVSNWRNERIRSDFYIFKYRRSDGRDQVKLRERKVSYYGAHAPPLTWAPPAT